MAPTAPRISRTLLRLFRMYCDAYYPRHMHRLLVAGEEHLRVQGAVVIYFNHPSWWDPLTCLQIAWRLLPDRKHYGPIDAAALERYRFLSKLGLFPLEQQTLRGARQFLTTAKAILKDPNACLWITPQGRFADVRERPLRFMPGLNHLDATCIPLALEYVFFEESKPEVLARFGAPANTRHEAALTAVMEQVAADAVARDVHAYRSILTGRVGVGGVYDLYRKCKAMLKGERFAPEHAETMKRRSAN